MVVIKKSKQNEIAEAVKAAKPRKHKIQRYLDKRSPLLVENTKKVLILKGHNTSQEVVDVLKDINLLTKPNCKTLSRKNEILPFEDITSLEFLCNKADCSLFALGSHTKKRPNNLILGRLFDTHILDMFELGIEDFHKIGSFGSLSKMLGSKPIFVFLGDKWENDNIFIRLQNFLIDFFRGTKLEKICLKSLDHVIGWTILDNNKIYCRVYNISYLKSGTRVPNVELNAMGPFMNISLRRTQLASNDIWNEANRQVKNNIIPKKIKNINRNNIGEKIGKIHMTKQNMDGLNRKGKKMKALRD